MQTANPFPPRFSTIAAIAVLIAAIAPPMWGQETPAITVGNARLVGVPDDWTHHHLVFSDPGSADDAARNGAYERWFSVVNEPRYVMQQLKRGLPVQGSAAVDAAWIEGARRVGREAGVWGLERRKFNRPTIDKDWSMVLGSAAPGVGAGMFPAKFSFNATSSSPINCASATTPDYTVYNTGATGSATQASVVAYDNLYSSCAGQVPSVYWAFNTSGKVVTSVVLSLNGNQLAYVQTPGSGNAQLVVLTWSKTPTGRTVTGSVSGTAITLTAGTLTSMDVGAVLSGGSIPAGDTIKTVTSGTVGTLTTAGTTASGTLTISADAGGPGTALANNGSYPSCVAPCAAILSFSGTTRSDTISSPYYDYASDTLFVGDGSGGLHKFHPGFQWSTGRGWVAVVLAKHDRAYEPGPRQRGRTCVCRRRLRIPLFSQFVGHRNQIVASGGEPRHCRWTHGRHYAGICLRDGVKRYQLDIGHECLCRRCEAVQRCHPATGQFWYSHYI